MATFATNERRELAKRIAQLERRTMQLERARTVRPRRQRTSGPLAVFGNAYMTAAWGAYPLGTSFEALGGTWAAGLTRGLAFDTGGPHYEIGRAGVYLLLFSSDYDSLRQFTVAPRINGTEDTDQQQLCHCSTDDPHFSMHALLDLDAGDEMTLGFKHATSSNLVIATATMSLFFMGV